MSLSFFFFQALKYTIGLRLSETEESLGSDFIEHGIKQHSPDKPSSGVIRSFPSLRRRICPSPPGLIFSTHDHDVKMTGANNPETQESVTTIL